MEDNEADRLKEFAKKADSATTMFETPEEFTDTDGSILLYRSNIVAIAINKPLGKDKIGFQNLADGR